MHYEVEQKHRVENMTAFADQLRQRGVTLAPAITQSDQYFAHPARDFAATDEALRIRTGGDNSFVTFKGPKLDAVTKTRRELELALHPDDADGTRFAELLAALGFKPVAAVRKRRRSFKIEHDALIIEGSLDDVEGVGTFVELELLADNETLEEAKQVIRQLAEQLRLGPTERRSYLEMLLEVRSQRV